MITEEDFLSEIRHIAHMRLISISVAAAKDVYPRFKEFEPDDLGKAVDLLIHSEDRFDFSKLLKTMAHRRADRLEAESANNRISESYAAKRFFDDSRYIGKCNRDVCRGCPHVKNCEVRGKEWIKGINAIMRSNLGTEGADQHIHYMKHEFMGGIE